MAEVRMQDPANGQGTVLAAVAELADEAETCRGIFAFASRQGIEMLFQAPTVQAVATNGDLQLVVGISAITDRAALERLAQLQGEYDGLRARVFWDRVNERLFHPKLCTFGYEGGATAALVGSGNLTPGGLRDNYEAFTVVRSAAGDRLNTASVDAFLLDNGRNLFPVDDPLVLARAGQNVRAVRRAAGERGGEEADIAVVPATGAEAGEVVLVAYAPRSRGGWAQLQLNLDVLAQFFRIPAEAGEALILQQRRLDNTLGPVENRVLVYPAATNQNIRVELAAAHGRAYPANGEGRPIVLFRDRGGRVFEYIALEPGNDGHPELSTMLDAAPDSIGRGVNRVVRPLPAVRRVWPGCPW